MFSRKRVNKKIINIDLINISEAFEYLVELPVRRDNIKKFHGFVNKARLTHSNLIDCLSHLTNTGERKSIEHKLRLVLSFIQRIETKLLKKSNKIDPQIIFQETQSAFKNRIRTCLISNIKHKNVYNFLKEAFLEIKNFLPNIFKTLHTIKISFDLCLKFEQNEKISDRNFTTKSYSLLPGSDFKKFSSDIIEHFLANIEEFQGCGSNFNFVGIIYLSAMFMKSNPCSGSGYIPLPREIAKRRACVNVNNGKNGIDCFLYAVNSALFPAHGNTANKYSYPHWSKRLDIGKIPLPMDPSNIPKFEKLNKLRINVYSYDSDAGFDIFPIYYSSINKITSTYPEINLLLFHNQEKSDYCWIKRLSALLHCTTKRHGKMYFCEKCKKICATQLLYERHKLKCKIETRESAPKENSILTFEKFKNKLFCPISIYADIEAALKPCDRKNSSNNTEGNTNIYQSHEAMGIGYYFVSQIAPEKSYYRSYWGSDIGLWFAKELHEIAFQYADVSIFFLNLLH